jgi:D-glycero-beta-D-manno-heptose 1-phosphate adenylyltransferase
MTNLRTDNLFADASNFEQRFMPDYAELGAKVRALKSLGFEIVLTSGSFDIIHEGHSMYLEAARQFGDFLVVGVDSDEKIRERKGEGRPVVPEMERLHMITHQRGVGLVTLKESWHGHWKLVDTVHPDVLVVTEDAYSATELARLENYVRPGRVEVLERMATVSTSARIRDFGQRFFPGYVRYGQGNLNR